MRLYYTTKKRFLFLVLKQIRIIYQPTMVDYIIFVRAGLA